MAERHREDTLLSQDPERQQVANKSIKMRQTIGSKSMKSVKSTKTATAGGDE